jgi:hypothetical protein
MMLRRGCGSYQHAPRTPASGAIELAREASPGGVRAAVGANVGLTSTSGRRVCDECDLCAVAEDSEHATLPLASN